MKEDTVALPVPAPKEAVSFVEIPCLPLQPNIQKVTDDGTAVAVIRTSALIIELTNDISNGIIAAILKELSYT